MAARLEVEGIVYKLYVNRGRLTIHNIYDEYVGHIEKDTVLYLTHSDFD